MLVLVGVASARSTPAAVSRARSWATSRASGSPVRSSARLPASLRGTASTTGEYANGPASGRSSAKLRSERSVPTRDTSVPEAGIQTSGCGPMSRCGLVSSSRGSCQASVCRRSAVTAAPAPAL
ncbi:hypothetical protein ACFUCQ_21660 [Streptomyces sp. NPDC057197]|uniref:hypothetical protein n=1 Tax=Streptomyces sp. NPDC057197 TaxID=3346045 RepID=UPI00363F5DCB